jgi:nicotinamidase-related amidase
MPRRDRSELDRPSRSSRRAADRSAKPNRPRVISNASVALLLIDVINDLSFEGAAPLIAQAEPMSERLAALKRRATRAGVPIIYVNDNFGRWRSDFRSTVAHCTARTSPGRVVSRRLKPTRRDYFVLKPQHSGFFQTTLDTLIGQLKIRQLILAGIAGNICVLFTANDAYMRGLKLYVPCDCVVSNTAHDNDAALAQMALVLKADTRPSTALQFSKRSAAARRSREP